MKSRINWGIFGILMLVLVFGAFPSGAQDQAPGAYLRASRILYTDVYDGNQELIGEVDDIIIRRIGRVKKLTVEFGGFLDLGDKLVAVSFKRIRMKNGDIALEATRKDLEQRPEYNYFAHGLRPGYYYRTRTPSGPYRYPPPRYYGAEPGPGLEGYEDWAGEWTFSPSRFLASVIMDRRVINEDGSHIGTVRDLLIDRKSRRVEKIVVSSERILGEGNYAALPYEPAGFTSFGLVYDILIRELKEMPAYTYEAP